MVNSFYNRIGIKILIIVLAGFVGYSFILGAPFKAMDDNSSIVNNADIRSFANIGKIFQQGFFKDRTYWRPLVSLSFMTEYHFFQLNPLYYYLTNIFFHLATAILVFFLIKEIFQDSNTGFFVSLLFVLHPVHWDAVSNISGRSIIFCGFFSIGAFLSYILAFQRGKSRVGYMGSLVLFVLALLCKESAAVFPLLILSFQFVLKPDSKGKFLFSIREALPFIFIDVFYFLFRHFLGLTALIKEVGIPRDIILDVGTFLRSVITDFYILVFPTQLYYDRARAIFKSYGDVEFVLTGLFFLGLLALFLKVKHRLAPQLRFFIYWFCIGLLPVSQLVPIKIQIGYIAAAEHFLYVPSVGFFVLAVVGLRGLYATQIKTKAVSPAILKFFTGGMYLYFFIVLVQHLLYSKNDMAMMERALEYNPRNVRVNNSVGSLYAGKSQFAKAEKYFREALEGDPRDTTARISLGKSLCDQGRYFEGIGEYERVVIPLDEKFEPFKNLLENNLRSAYGALIGQYQKQLKEDPDNALLHFSLGVAYSKTSNIKEAIREYEVAIALNPHLKGALFNLAASYEAEGKIDKAVIYYEKIVSLSGAEDILQADACLRLADLYHSLGDEQKGKAYRQQSEKIRASLPQNAQNLILKKF